MRVAGRRLRRTIHNRVPLLVLCILTLCAVALAGASTIVMALVVMALFLPWHFLVMALFVMALAGMSILPSSHLSKERNICGAAPKLSGTQDIHICADDFPAEAQQISQ